MFLSRSVLKDRTPFLFEGGEQNVKEEGRRCRWSNGYSVEKGVRETPGP